MHTFLRDEPFNASFEMLKENKRNRIYVSIAKKTALNYFSTERNHSASKFQNVPKNEKNASKRKRNSSSPTSSTPTSTPTSKESSASNESKNEDDTNINVIHSNANPFTIDLSSMHFRRCLIEDIVCLNENGKFLLLVSRDINAFDCWQSVARQQAKNSPVTHVGCYSCFQI